MEREFVTLNGYRTGALENTTTIRNSFAFDLSLVEPQDQIIVSGALHLRTAAANAAQSIVLSDPSAEVAYGNAVLDCRAATSIRVPLTREAVADLQQAQGGFFSVDAVVENEAGEPQFLAATDIPIVLVLGLAPANLSSLAAA